MEIVDSVGVARYKTTGWHELLTMLDHSIVVEKLKESRVYDVDIPRMPKDVLLTSTRLFDNGQAQVKVTGFVKGIEYPFLYQERSYLIQIPNIIYRATWQKQGEGDGRLSSLSLAEPQAMSQQKKQNYTTGRLATCIQAEASAGAYKMSNVGCMKLLTKVCSASSKPQTIVICLVQGQAKIHRTETTKDSLLQLKRHIVCHKNG